jgi:protein-disulfide isomerase
METISSTRKWYRKWWGITIMAVICFLLAMIIALLALSYRYWQLIKSGHGDNLAKYFSAQSLEKAEDPAIEKIRLEVESTDDPFVGNAEAPFVIVEYLDFKCPVCKAQDPILKQVIAKYGDSVKLIVRDFPIESTHSGATRLAEFVSCAYEQGVFWPIHDYLFQAQDELGDNIDMTLIESLSQRFNLNFTNIKTCLENGIGKTEVNIDYGSSLKNGARRGTPSFFVNGHLIEGLVPLENWEKAIQTFNQ